MREKYRNANLLHLYGMTPSQWKQLHEAQNNVCGVCGERAPSTRAYARRLMVDHNHETGKIRGLVCIGCNALVAAVEPRMDRYRQAMAWVMTDGHPAAAHLDGPRRQKRVPKKTA